MIPKKSLGLLFAGLSFMVILLPAYFGGERALVNPLWLVLSYFIVVLGELCLSPVGLSATTKLAPAAFSAQTMSLKKRQGHDLFLDALIMRRLRYS